MTSFLLFKGGATPHKGSCSSPPGISAQKERAGPKDPTLQRSNAELALEDGSTNDLDRPAQTPPGQNEDQPYAQSTSDNRDQRTEAQTAGNGVNDRLERGKGYSRSTRRPPPSFLKKSTSGRGSLGAGAGIEPAALADEASMLPLHYPAI